MKKLAKLLMATLLTLSTLVPVTGCKKSEKATSTRPAKDSCQTLNTNSYDLVVPTGTIVASDEPELPEAVVYWDPSRDLKEKYTIEEALKKYAIVVGHSTLIYTACDELRMDHSFYCTDYGAKRFENSNSAFFLGSDGNPIDGLVTRADLRDPDCSSLSEFKENLGWLYVGNMGYYSPEDPDAPKITIFEELDDHIFASVKNTPPYSEEGLYYATVIDGKVFYSVYKIISRDDEFTDEDRQEFLRYSKILFEHLSPDDKVEPYLYDKLVNTPILGGRFITSFGHIEYIYGKSIGLDTKDDSPIYYGSLAIDAPDSYLEKGIDDTDWVDANGMQMRENKYSDYQEFVFTIDGTRYLLHVFGRNDKKIEVDSLDALLKLIEKGCYITGS